MSSVPKPGSSIQQRRCRMAAKLPVLFTYQPRWSSRHPSLTTSRRRMLVIGVEELLDPGKLRPRRPPMPTVGTCDTSMASARTSPLIVTCSTPRSPSLPWPRESAASAAREHPQRQPRGWSSTSPSLSSPLVTKDKVQLFSSAMSSSPSQKHQCAQAAAAEDGAAATGLTPAPPPNTAPMNSKTT